MPTDNSNHETPLQGQNPPPQYPGYLPYPYSDDEIDLRELWTAVWQGKWLIIAITAVFATSSVIYALTLPDIYQSEVLLAPSEESQGGGLSQMAGQFGGLAALAGISLGSASGDNKIAIAMEVIKSRKFITAFVEKHDILPELMAVEDWDSGNDKLIFNSNLYDSAQNKWVRPVEAPQKPEPSAWEAYKAFMNILTVSQKTENGLVTVAVEHQSPTIAARWAALLVEEVNAVMKEQDVAEAQRSIEYLNKQLGRVALADMRTVFYQLIEEQTKTIMLAEVRDEYVFSTIDPAVVPEEKAKPKRALICVLGTMLGSILAVMFVVIRHFVLGNNGSRRRQA